MVALSGIGEQLPVVAVWATIPASSVQARFSGPLPCFSQSRVLAMTDLRKLALAAIAISGLAIGLLAATLATASAGMMMGL
jgi:hypothetical protein